MAFVFTIKTIPNKLSDLVSWFLKHSKILDLAICVPYSSCLLISTLVYGSELKPLKV